MEYKEIIFDISTNEVTERLYTEEEVLMIEEEMVRVAELNKEAELKEKNRQSALAKLAALGLTEEEIAAL